VGSVRDELAEWAEWDEAGWSIAMHLGLLPPGVSYQTEAKHVFWTSNPLWDAIHDVLDAMVRVGALEYEPEEQRWRARPEYAWHDASSKPGR
jgi:hypothetical protein